MFPQIVTGEEAVLMWSNERAQRFNLSVTDFCSCWNDGKVVTAIINTLFPNDFKFNEMTFSDPVKDMKVAWECLKKNKVVIYLEPEDFLMKKPDTKSVTLFAAELMKYSQGNYEGYDEKKFEEAKRKREEEERKAEEEEAKRKQDAIDALPKCIVCNLPITTTPYEFAGYPYHDTCVKCNACKKPLRIQALNVNDLPYCELCARNTFQKMKADGWEPPAGVRQPVKMRIGRYTGEKKEPPKPFVASEDNQPKLSPRVVETAKPEPKREEPKMSPRQMVQLKPTQTNEAKKEVKEEPKMSPRQMVQLKPVQKEEPPKVSPRKEGEELLSRNVVKKERDGNYMVETIEELYMDHVNNKKKKKIIKRKVALTAAQIKELEEEEEIRRLEAELAELEGN